MPDIAKLTVRLEAENSKLSKALTKSGRDVKRFENQARKSVRAVRSSLGGLAATLGVGLTVVGFVSGTKAALAYADAIDKAAKVAGLTTTELQELRFAGEQLGISEKLVDEGFRRLGRRLGEFANSGAGPAQKALEKLNIEIRESGRVRSTGDVFNEIVRKLEDVETQSQKSALAAQLFGDDAGPKLALLLAEGAQGINSLRQEAQDIGAVLESDVIDNAVQAQDSLAKLSRVLKTQLTTALVELAPILTEAANGLIDLSRWARTTFGDIQNLGRVAAETKISKLLVDLDRLQDQLVETRRIESSNSLKDSLLNLLPNIPSERLEEKVKETQDKLTKAYARISELDFNETVKANIKLDVDLENDINDVAGQAGAAANEIRDEISKAFVPLDAQVQAFRALNIEAENLRVSLRTPFEAANDEIERLDILLAADVITLDTWGRGFNAALDGVADETEEVTSKMSVFSEQAARNMQDDFAEFLFDPFVEDGLKGMLDGFVTTLRQMAAQAAAAQIFESLGAGLSGQGGFLGSIGSFITTATRATGGPLAAGQPAIVGERGRELFIPDRPGMVVSNENLAGVGGITVNVTAPSGSGSTQSPSQFGFEVAQALRIATGRNG